MWVCAPPLSGVTHTAAFPSSPGLLNVLLKDNSAEWMLPVIKLYVGLKTITRQSMGAVFNATWAEWELFFKQWTCRLLYVSVCDKHWQNLFSPHSSPLQTDWPRHQKHLGSSCEYQSYVCTACKDQFTQLNKYNTCRDQWEHIPNCLVITLSYPNCD